MSGFNGTAFKGLTQADIVDSLTSTATDKPLSAAQGNVLNDKIILHSLGNISSMDDLKTAMNTLAASRGSGQYVHFTFAPTFTDNDAGFYNTAYGERYGYINIRTPTRFCAIITFQNGTVTRMANNNGTWNISKFAMSDGAPTNIATHTDATAVNTEVSFDSSVNSIYFSIFPQGNAYGGVTSEYRRKNGSVDVTLLASNSGTIFNVGYNINWQSNKVILKANGLPYLWASEIYKA